MAAEEFLRDFHDRFPGRQSAGVEAVRTAAGRTSYQEFADRIPDVGRVLDLGCADGTLLEVLAARGATGLAGVDLSESELALARRRPALAAADLRRTRAQELPFERDAFDTVVSHMAFMLMADPENVIAEAARVLAPGGRFAVAVGGGPVPGEAMELFISLLRPHLRATDHPMPRLGDRRTRSREGLDELLRPAGFAPVSWGSIVIDQPGTPERVWDSNLSMVYDVTVLDADVLADVRRSFLAEAGPRTVDGRLASGMRINFAVTRLLPVR